MSPSVTVAPVSARSVLDQLQPPIRDDERVSRVEVAVEVVTQEISELGSLADRARTGEPPDATLAAQCAALQERLAASRRVLRYEDDETVDEIVRAARGRLELIRTGDIAEL